MKKNVKLQIIYQGVTFYTKRNKLVESFDFYTAQAVDYACKAIEDCGRQDGEEPLSIVGSFGHIIQRDIQVRIIK